MTCTRNFDCTINCEKDDLEERIATLTAEVAALKAAIVTWARDVNTGSLNHGLNLSPEQVLAAILARATPPQDGGKE